MPTLRMRALLPFLLVMVQPVAAWGQLPTHTLNPGDEVQVHAPAVRPARVRGTVVLYQGSTLEMREARSDSVLSIPVASIQFLARNEGLHRGSSSWRMARLGGFVGGAGGLVAGPLIATSRAPKNFGQIMLVSGVVGTLAGTGVGAAVGALFARDQWQRFRMPIIPTAAVEPGAIQIGVSASIR